MDYSEFFKQATGWPEPQGWQSELIESSPESRLIRIPTGFGKTLGVLLAWLWHRHQKNDEDWPRRLVWCLPMRVLVEQTIDETEAVLDRLGIRWDEKSGHEGKVGVHALMGGVDAGDWHLHPERSAVLIGTQDMLLSRALNRGYGAARARWPMEFGLLNQDCLWVMDEVQLMDVGLATSGQMQVFREQDRQTGKSYRPCRTWWMSATLQRSWLTKSPETTAIAKMLSQTDIPPPSRVGHLWTDVSKPVRLVPVQNDKAIADIAAQAHLTGERGKLGPTLLVLNRVDNAVAVYEALTRNKELQGTDIRLIHSRFRPQERVNWRQNFLNRAACAPGTDRIIVATQVVEAGVDMSAAVLVTALAPWPSLVQRFGRAARWGGKADIIVVDQEPKDDKAAAPYSKDELDAARKALDHLNEVSPLHLEAFEESHQDLLPSLYPYNPKTLLLRHEVDELFDTTPDLSGADVDISRFIRSGDERDLQVFWHPVEKDTYPDRKLRPGRAALCNVPFLKARDWLCGKESATAKAPRLKLAMRAWVWDWLEGIWRRVERRDLYPGQTVLVATDCGGYIELAGWSPDSKQTVTPVTLPKLPSDEEADASENDESLSAYPWQTIAVHGATVGRMAADIASILLPDKTKLLDLAGRWHDAGKVHEAFQNSIQTTQRPARHDLAKAPADAWVKGRKLYAMLDGHHRPGFRHELASTLALFAVLRRHNPQHPALLGPWQEFFAVAGIASQILSASASTPNPLEQEIIALSANDFDLLAYLVCSHHGKVRVTWHASPFDQKAADDRLRIRGIRDGETLPAVLLAMVDGTYSELPSSLMNLAPSAVGLSPSTGRGWTERVLNLLKRHGPFTLAWLEALLRAADQRASRLPINDPLLEIKEEAP